MAGIGSLLKSDESAAFRQIDTRLKTGTLREKQLLIALLGKLETPTATQRLLQLIESWSSLPPEILVDVWKASERRKDCEAHFSKLRASLKKDGDSLAEYRIALSGGNPIQGRQLFYQSPVALCSRCHKAEPLVPAGGAGPSLEGVGARGEEYLLRSLLEPSAEFAPGYASLAVTLKTGETLAGTLWKREAQRIDIRFANGQVRTIPTQEIQTMNEPVSPMPPMGSLLGLGEIRDIVAFLKTLTRENQKLLASKKLQPEELAQKSASELDVER
jgi:putative heme-binding domain-containing protein